MGGVNSTLFLLGGRSKEVLQTSIKGTSTVPLALSGRLACEIHLGSISAVGKDTLSVRSTISLQIMH